MRRKKLDSSAEPALREAVATSVLNPGGRSGSSFPTVITSANTVHRPSDIFLESSLAKPAIPPRFSIKKSEGSRLQISSSYGDVAEKIVAAAMNPVFDGVENSKSSLQSNSSSMPPPQATSSGVPSRFSLHEIRGSSEVPKRVHHNRLDLDIWRRRSEPVTSVVKEAVCLHLEDTDDSRLKKKSIYENKEDLRESLQDGARKSREKLNLRQEIMRSRERLNALDNICEGQTHGKDEPVLRSSSAPRVSAPALASLPPATPGKSSSSTTAGKFSVSPRFLRVGSLGDSKILSRKSRSLSSTDVSDIRQAFRDRFSWRGEPSLSRSSQKSGQNKGQIVKDVKPNLDNNELQRGMNSKTDDGVRNADGSARLSDGGETQQNRIDVIQCSDSTSSEGRSDRDMDYLESKSDPSERKDSAMNESEQKLTIFNRAVRENASRPLSVSSRNVDQKDKKP